jgi:dTDP-4-amino-4,6-dideoxygalactose transaminase
MNNSEYNQYSKNFEIDKKMEDKIVATLRNNDLSWPFGATKELERNISRFLNVKYALAHCNGTSAMYAAMFAAGVGRNTEVICPTYTFWASIAPAVNLGARVIFCDINKDDLLIDTSSVEKNITSKTKAIIAPHLWGRLCNIDKLKKICNRHNRKIYIIEDSSHCFGAKYKDKFLGTLGDVGIFSLQAGKPLIAGEGGMLVTDNFEIYDAAMYLGHYERIKLSSRTRYAGYSKTGGGYKFRIHPLASAIAITHLKGVKERLQRHNKLMLYYESGLNGINQLQILKKPYKNFDYGGRFGLRATLKIDSGRRSTFMKECNKKGLLIEEEYIPLLHRERFFLDHGAKKAGKNAFKETEKIHSSLISLPIFYKGNNDIINIYVRDLGNLLKKYN